MSIKSIIKYSRTRGATIVEYALIVAIMVVAGVAIFGRLQTGAQNAASNAAVILEKK